MMTSRNKNKSSHFSFSKGRIPDYIKTEAPVLFMNVKTMKKLKYNKGSLILIQTDQGQLLFRCWPCEFVDTSSLMVSSVQFFQEYLNGPVFCDLYKSYLDSSYMVILNSEDYKPFMDKEYFREFLKTQLSSVFIREDLKFHTSCLGYPCSFTVKKIYSNSSGVITYNDSVQEICTNISFLNISKDESVSGDSISEISTPFCSTPISKHSLNITDFPSKEITCLKQFYTVNSNTKIIIEKSQNITSCSNQIRLCHLGGLKKPIAELETSVMSLLNEDSLGKESNCGIILVGAPGIGKTAAVHALANEYGLPVFDINDIIFSSDEDGYKYQLKKLYNEIEDKSPCILFLDGLDNYKNKVNEYSQESRQTHLSTMIHDLLKSKHNILVIGATHHINNVDSSLRKPGTLEKEIYFEIPSADERKQILEKILEQKNHSLNKHQITEISEVTHGFTGGDLKFLCDKADVFSSNTAITFEDLKEILKDVKPRSMAEFLFEIPKVKWTDIGGMHAVKTAVKEMVEWPLKYAEQFKNLGILPSRGILLYGPPGCSKTMIAKALVSEGHLNFISIKGPQLFNKYVGESEKAVSELFKKARSAAPCVLFFDEIDSLTPVRGSISGNSNVSERILTQMLVEIDGIDVLQGVSIIAATNRPDMIDPSFLRPGRFDQMIYVPLPDSATRKEIFEAKLKKIPHASDIDISYLIEATEGYTGAEIADVCREAAMSAIKEYITSSSVVVTMLHLLLAIKTVVPRTSKEMIDFYENYYKRNK